MAQSSFEQVLKEVQALPPEDVARLREILNAPNETEQQNGATRTAAQEEARKPDAVREMARAASLRNLTAERQWLKEHCDEYAGQWVALKGDQLISHGKDHLAVYQAAKAAGHSDALMELVEPSDALPFIF
jgi:hypothetical protein